MANFDFEPLLRPAPLSRESYVAQLAQLCNNGTLTDEQASEISGYKLALTNEERELLKHWFEILFVEKWDAGSSRRHVT